MPTRSSPSSVLRWPGREAVGAAVRAFAHAEAARRPELVRLGYFGSYARGDDGPGSDLDLVAVVRGDPGPFERRGTAWKLESLPVPAEILVYAESEWAEVLGRGDRFARAMRDEVVWVV